MKCSICETLKNEKHTKGDGICENCRSNRKLIILWDWYDIKHSVRRDFRLYLIIFPLCFVMNAVIQYMHGGILKVIITSTGLLFVYSMCLCMYRFYLIPKYRKDVLEQMFLAKLRGKEDEISL